MGERGGGKKHLDIATNSTVDISNKNDQQFLSSKKSRGCAIFSITKIVDHFLDISTVEFVAMFRCFFPPPAPSSYERVNIYCKSAPLICPQGPTNWNIL